MSEEDVMSRTVSLGEALQRVDSTMLKQEAEVLVAAGFEINGISTSF